MTQISQARDISLEELHCHFNLEIATSEDFFGEWRASLPAATDYEKGLLERVQQNYLNLASRRSFSEEAVKMVVLSPLLDLAGFYQTPFSLQTEESIEIEAEDEAVVIRGSIDVLVICRQFWVLVIESKSTRFDVMTALPQALAYMLDTPNREKPVYGLLVNGREFVFIKLLQHPAPVYARSFALSIERDNELVQVLGTLKNIRQSILEQPA
ncbi:type I restriction endonuclease subunit R [Romeria aff. gracilis LEGE 07310]|uniref:Type I restriction endonuclease subunit R n=1 Tax=Vasconcelosia minhoensis LEGE 07310 TaxID=915328 RepID=A0A8J7AS01_9CYAN|nr:type I restriction endonuclease subunit R [Romeria gracilis]MBE9079546.1 type I restriction endonuclease subunit R [Romeria aff. gracilis LEGE 07310]